jgi:hypothetical protein
MPVDRSLLIVLGPTAAIRPVFDRDAICFPGRETGRHLGPNVESANVRRG